MLSGPAGVGKSTVSWEISEQLRAGNVPHVLLDSDELDRVWPLEEDERRDLNRANLGAFWRNAAALRHERLVLVGVFLRPNADREWIESAVPAASITKTVLIASDAELERRIRGRELGSGADEHVQRSLAQSQRFRRRAGGATKILDTDAATVPEIASELISQIGWTASTPYAMRYAERATLARAHGRAHVRRAFGA
jgi:hypothetical protein